MTEEIFIKILKGTASEAEKKEFYQAMEEDRAQREIFLSYKNLYAVSNIDSAKQIDRQKDSFDKFWRKANLAKSFRIFEFWYRYAAVFVVALLMGFMIQYLMPKQQQIKGFVRQIEYTSEKGSVSTIHLEDGSSIWLSSASKLIIRNNPDGEIIAQLNGEAYFDLVPDPARKLTVDLGKLKVRDIGTKFNIRAYSTESGIYSSLVDGKVDLYNFENKPVLSMKPGEYSQFNKNDGQMVVSQRDPTIATAWKDGKFVFIDKSLAEICRELENWYNVEIIISNPKLANTKYTSVIKRTTTVSMVLKMLSLTDQINYKITDRKEGRDKVTIF
jgi:ferric-dicitrate binding protein FerR (iron transport regulator)